MELYKDFWLGHLEHVCEPLSNWPESNLLV